MPAGGSVDRVPFLIFSPGDAHKVSTWSNVPYFFTQALERQGHTVVRVDIGTARLLKKVYDGSWTVLRMMRVTRTRHGFFHSRIHYWVTQRRIERELRAHPGHHPLFFTYTFGANAQGRPYTLFCDMTFQKAIRYFSGRRPDALERQTVRREKRNLDEATRIISLFPKLADELRQQHGDKVRYFGNVLNVDDLQAGHGTLERSLKGNEIVFVGKEHYLEGLHLLLEALPLLNELRRDPVHLHVVGLTQAQARIGVPEHVTFHGYLDKADTEQRRTYYDLLERARLFVNPNPKWGAFSASLEAMYLHTPVVLFPYMEFTRTFPRHEEMGYFLRNADAPELAVTLAHAFDDREAWTQKAMTAHEAVKDMTWEKYVRRFLEDLNGTR